MIINGPELRQKRFCKHQKNIVVYNFCAPLATVLWMHSNNENSRGEIPNCPCRILGKVFNHAVLRFSSTTTRVYWHILVKTLAGCLVNLKPGNCPSWKKLVGFLGWVISVQSVWTGFKYEGSCRRAEYGRDVLVYF